MSELLTNKKILVTRPTDQAKGLASAIEDKKGIPVLFPVLSIHSIYNAKQEEDIIANIELSHYFIFVSRNAVTCCTTKVIKALQNYIKKNPNTHIVSMGPATTAALKEIKITSTLDPAPGTTSETVLEDESLQHKSIKLDHGILFCGRKGRAVLQTTLLERGMKLYAAKIYETRCPKIHAEPLVEKWRETGLDVVTVTSNNAIDNLLKLVGRSNTDWLKDQKLVVISKRMEDHAKYLNFKNVYTANSAQDSDIVNKLLQIL